MTGLLGDRLLFIGGNPIDPLRKTLAGQIVERPKYRWSNLIEDFAPVCHYFSNVPAWEAHLVARYWDRQWRMLELAARCGSSALDLVASNPALAYCVASYPSFVPGRPSVDFSHLARLLQMRRRDICGYLGFSAHESIVRIFEKVPPEHCYVSRLRSLRERLRCARLRKTLAHLPVINKAVLAVLHSKVHESVTPSFLAECSSFSEAELESIFPEKLLKDAAGIYHQWEKRLLPKRLFRSVKQLQQFIEETERRYNDEEFLKAINFEFLAAPFPGTEAIQPLSTSFLLLEEAEEQHNCIRAYATDIAGGSRYFYRMIAPERVTIGLVKMKAGWQLSEIAGTFNKSVAAETRQIVEEWLAKQRQHPSRDSGKRLLRLLRPKKVGVVGLLQKSERKEDSGKEVRKRSLEVPPPPPNDSSFLSDDGHLVRESKGESRTRFPSKPWKFILVRKAKI